MTKAIWNGKIIAECKKSECEEVEGNIYFPPSTIEKKFLKKSNYHTTYYWKGEASYYDIVVSGKANKDAAWYYPSPKEKAKHIKNYVAFWRGVEVKA